MTTKVAAQYFFWSCFVSRQKYLLVVIINDYAHCPSYLNETKVHVLKTSNHIILIKSIITILSNKNIVIYDLRT